MLGMGETDGEVIAAMQDLRDRDCDYLTLGQYLAPSINHYPVKEFIHPGQFKKYRDIGKSMGFKGVFSGPKVRSSYHAQELSKELNYA
jgi:lipoic acid synthetase